MLGTDLPTAWSSNDGEELASPPSLVKKKQKTGNKGNHAWDLYIITVQTNKPTNSSSGEINPPGSSINTSATSANMIFFFPPLRLKIKGGLYLRDNSFIWEEFSFLLNWIYWTKIKREVISRDARKATASWWQTAIKDKMTYWCTAAANVLCCVVGHLWCKICWVSLKKKKRKGATLYSHSLEKKKIPPWFWSIR